HCPRGDCREDESFHHARPVAQTVECFRQRCLGKRQPLANLDRRGVMTEPSDQQFHGISVGLNPACAIQVRAPQPSTTKAMTAALRPRQPAEARMKIIARHKAQVKIEREILGLPTHLVPSSMNAHSNPKITPSVISTKPKPMELLMRSSSVPSGGSFSSSLGLLLLLRRRS